MPGANKRDYDGYRVVDSTNNGVLSVAMESFRLGVDAQLSAPLDGPSPEDEKLCKNLTFHKSIK